jgi:hypothetical protein
MRNDGTRRAQRRQLYRRSTRQCDDSFPKKNVPFYFNNLRNPDTVLRSQKVRSLKDFNVCGVLGKELPHNR